MRRRSARPACLIAGLAVKRSSVIVRVKGIDEPSDNDNTWDNAAEDQKKGPSCSSETSFASLQVQVYWHCHQLFLFVMQAQQLELDSGLPSPSQSLVSQSLKMTLQTTRMGMCIARTLGDCLAFAYLFAPSHARNCGSSHGGCCLV